MKTLFIVGAGGHSKVVIDSLHESKLADTEYRLVLVDDNHEKHGKNLMGAPILGPLSRVLEERTEGACFHLALGDNSQRKRIAQYIESLIPKPEFVSVFHPTSSISKWSEVGEGSFVAAQSVIGPQARIGSHVIINHGATVDHDSAVQDFCHIGPGATLCGTVSIDEGVLMGAGSTIIPNLTVGSWTLVGAGGVVVNSLPPNLIVKGNPAK